MARHSLISKLTSPGPAIGLALVMFAALIVMTAASQHTAVFDRYYASILAVNVIGALVLCALIVANLWRLRKQYRARVLGSRLTVRFVTVFALLVIVPLAVVYYFALQFLSRGIDSWFDQRIEQALDDAVLLGQSSLEATRQDLLQEGRSASLSLAEVIDSPLDTIRLLGDLRANNGYAEMSVFSRSGQIVASATAEPLLLPDTPDDSMMSEAHRGGQYAGLEPLGDGGLQLRILMPLPASGVTESEYLLQVLDVLPTRYSRLGESVQAAKSEYERLQYLRGPLQFSFVLTLTLVALVTTLIALWLALVSSRRLVAPLRDLAEGTRAVAHGDYRKQLPVSTQDELGVLVQSFNEMTRRIHEAQSQAHRSRQLVEQQHAYLDTVLNHLSSGVVSFDSDRRLKTSNAAAAEILDVDFSARSDWNTAELEIRFPWVEPLLTALSTALSGGVEEWQEEIVLFGHKGRQVLLCRGKRLPGDEIDGGTVIVFDDITQLIQAQRNAAWGEVARRLAHEIKNPLTPIQLSAERIRHKYLDTVPPDKRDALDRATRTIAQQVDHLKAMVNAFSEYAQPVHMQTIPLNMNQLVQDVVELHRRDDRSLELDVDLDPQLPLISADPLRIRQIMNNMIINVRQATRMQTGAKLIIRTRLNKSLTPGAVELTVEDDGPGFPPELLDRLFEPYVTTRPKGTGLGLAIVKRIVEEHSGSIAADNMPGGGARIRIRLPLESGETFDAAYSPAPPVRTKIA